MRPILIAASIVAGAALLWFGGRIVLGFTRVTATSPTPASPTAAPDDGHGRLARVLDQYVVDGRVDYDRLAQQGSTLAQYVASLATAGPQSTPEQFPDDSARLAYYLNAYNALVVHAVIAHWPIGSVHEVRGPIEPKAGFGFFYALSFDLDGETINLYDLENRHIRGFGDARIHAAINCASASCPALRAAPFEGSQLDAQLEDATRTFVGDPQHVALTNGRIVLNPIFDWYRADFETHAKPWGGTLLDFVAHYIDEERREALRSARAAGHPVVFGNYDWDLNRQR